MLLGHGQSQAHVPSKRDLSVFDHGLIGADDDAVHLKADVVVELSGG